MPSSVWSQLGRYLDFCWLVVRLWGNMVLGSQNTQLCSSSFVGRTLFFWCCDLGMGFGSLSCGSVSILEARFLSTVPGKVWQQISPVYTWSSMRRLIPVFWSCSPLLQHHPLEFLVSGQYGGMEKAWHFLTVSLESSLVRVEKEQSC